MSHFKHGFLNGVTVRGLPLMQVHPGKVFWVGNATGALLEGAVVGSDGNRGDMLHPFATIQKAIGSTVANRGDIIVVGPGHVENLTASNVIALNKGGVALLGLGMGSLRPKLQFDHASALVTVSADNVTIMNMNFRASVTAVVNAISVSDGVDDVAILNNVFDVDAEGTDEFNDAIQLNDASNRALIEGNTIDMGIAGAVSAIAMVKDTDRTVIRKNVIRGDYSTANIRGATTLSTRLLIEDNLLENGIGGNLGTEPAIELVTGSTGTIRRNDIVCNLATKAASVVADTCLLFENYYNEDISGAATGGLIGTASADD